MGGPSEAGTGDRNSRSTDSGVRLHEDRSSVSISCADEAIAAQGLLLEETSRDEVNGGIHARRRTTRIMVGPAEPTAVLAIAPLAVEDRTVAAPLDNSKPGAGCCRRNWATFRRFPWWIQALWLLVIVGLQVAIALLIVALVQLMSLRDSHFSIRADSLRLESLWEPEWTLHVGATVRNPSLLSVHVHEPRAQADLRWVMRPLETGPLAQERCQEQWSRVAEKQQHAFSTTNLTKAADGTLHSEASLLQAAAHPSSSRLHLSSRSTAAHSVRMTLSPQFDALEAQLARMNVLANLTLLAPASGNDAITGCALAFEELRDCGCLGVDFSVHVWADAHWSVLGIGGSKAIDSRFSTSLGSLVPRSEQSSSKSESESDADFGAVGLSQTKVRVVDDLLAVLVRFSLPISFIDATQTALLSSDFPDAFRVEVLDASDEDADYFWLRSFARTASSPSAVAANVSLLHELRWEEQQALSVVSRLGVRSRTFERIKPVAANTGAATYEHIVELRVEGAITLLADAHSGVALARLLCYASESLGFTLPFDALSALTNVTAPMVAASDSDQPAWRRSLQVSQPPCFLEATEPTSIPLCDAARADAWRRALWLDHQLTAMDWAAPPLRAPWSSSAVLFPPEVAVPDQWSDVDPVATLGWPVQSPAGPQGSRLNELLRFELLDNLVARALTPAGAVASNNSGTPAGAVASNNTSSSWTMPRLVSIKVPQRLHLTPADEAPTAAVAVGAAGSLGPEEESSSFLLQLELDCSVLFSELHLQASGFLPPLFADLHVLPIGGRFDNGSADSDADPNTASSIVPHVLTVQLQPLLLDDSISRFQLQLHVVDRNPRWTSATLVQALMMGIREQPRNESEATSSSFVDDLRAEPFQLRVQAWRWEEVLAAASHAFSTTSPAAPLLYTLASDLVLDVPTAFLALTDGGALESLLPQLLTFDDYKYAGGSSACDGAVGLPPATAAEEEEPSSRCAFNLSDAKTYGYTDWIGLPAIQFGVVADLFVVHEDSWREAVQPDVPRRGGVIAPSDEAATTLPLLHAHARPPSPPVAALLASYRLAIGTQRTYLNQALSIAAQFQVKAPVEPPAGLPECSATMPQQWTANMTVADSANATTNGGVAPRCMLTDEDGSVHASFASYYSSQLLLPPRGQTQQPQTTGQWPVLWPRAPLWVQLRLSSIIDDKSVPSVADLETAGDGQINTWRSGFYFDPRTPMQESSMPTVSSAAEPPVFSFSMSSSLGHLSVLLRVDDSPSFACGSVPDDSLAGITVLELNFTASAGATNATQAAWATRCGDLVAANAATNSRGLLVVSMLETLDDAPATALCVVDRFLLPPSTSATLAEAARVQSETAALVKDGSLLLVHPRLQQARTARVHSCHAEDVAAVRLPTRFDAACITATPMADDPQQLPHLHDARVLPCAASVASCGAQGGPACDAPLTVTSGAERLNGTVCVWSCATAADCPAATDASVTSSSCLQCECELHVPVPASSAAGASDTNTSWPRSWSLCLASGGEGAACDAEWSFAR